MLFLTICLLCSDWFAYSSNVMNNSIPTVIAQEASIARLERAGFRFTCWFDAHDNNGGQCATMTKRIDRVQRRQCEVDPDGTCNGLTVDAYLASLA